MQEISLTLCVLLLLLVVSRNPAPGTAVLGAVDVFRLPYAEHVSYSRMQPAVGADSMSSIATQLLSCSEISEAVGTPANHVLQAAAVSDPRVQ